MRTTNFRNMLFAALLTIALPLSAKDLTISAAVGLSNPFKELAAHYEHRHPEITVRLNSAASGVLVQQMSRGAAVDVLAVADAQSMADAVADNTIDKNSVADFASNELVLIVPRDSKIRLNNLQDLTQPAIRKLAMGNPKFTPIGRYSTAALKKAGLETAVANKLILTQNIRQSLDYAARGEVDGSFVFRSEAVLHPDKVKIAMQVPTEQPIVFTIGAAVKGDKAEAKRFIDFILSPQGRQILHKHGFLTPR